MKKKVFFFANTLITVFVLGACNVSPTPKIISTIQPKPTIVITKTPAATATYTQNATSIPTASITPAVITKQPLHNLALNTSNVQKIKNLAIFGKSDGSCYRSSELGGTIQTVLRNEKIEYMLADKYLNFRKDKVEIWNLETQTIVQSFSSVDIDNILFHPDQNSLISSTRNEKLTLKLWNIESGNELFSFFLEGGYAAERIIVSPDGLKIALFSGRGDGSGFRVNELNLQTNRVSDFYYDLPFYYDVVPPYLYSAKGNVFAVTYAKDEKLYLINLSNEKEMVLEFPFHSRDDVFDAEAIISTLAIAPDEMRLVGGGLNGSIYIWNIEKGNLIKPINAHTPNRVDGWVGGVKILEFSPQSNLLLSVGYDDFTKLWDGKTGNLLKEIKGCHHFGGFTQDGRYLVLAGKSGIELWGIP